MNIYDVIIEPVYFGNPLSIAVNVGGTTLLEKLQVKMLQGTKAFPNILRKIINV